MDRVLRILVVEDDQVDAERARRLIESEGSAIEVTQVSNGWEALQYLQQGAASGNLPDLVFADEVMPRMGGWELLQAVKQDSLLAALPIYMLTTWSVDGAIEKSYQLGAAGHISKTEDQEMLAAAILSMIRLHRQAAA